MGCFRNWQWLRDCQDVDQLLLRLTSGVISASVLSLLSFYISYMLGHLEAIAQVKPLPTISLQDLPANLFEVADCERDLLSLSQTNSFQTSDSQTNSSQTSDSSKAAIVNTFCFQRLDRHQDEFIFGTVICHNCNRQVTASSSVLSSPPQAIIQKAITGLNPNDLTTILQRVNRRYHSPLTWVSLTEFNLTNLGDGNLGLSAHGNSRNGKYQYFQVLVFGREQIFVVLVSGHSQTSLAVLNMPDLAYGLDQRLARWLKLEG